MNHQIQKTHLNRVEKAWVAHCIDQELRRRAEADAENELAVHQAKVRLNVMMARIMTSGRPDAAFFSEQEMATMMPIFLIAESRQNPERSRLAAHEMAHYLMREWVAPALYGADSVVCTDQDNVATRHEIAREVDEKWTDRHTRHMEAAEGGGSGGGSGVVSGLGDAPAPDVVDAFKAAWKMHLGTRKRIY